MKLSVVIPVYNAEKEIGDCLNAICNSKYTPNEVIVVDDFSSDRSALVASRFKCRIIKNKVNKGPAESRNIGGFAAKGDLILFLDSDIIVSEDTLTKIVHSFNEYPQIAGTWCIMSKRHPHTNFCSQYKNLFLHFYAMQLEKFGSHFVSAVATLKREIFVESGGFDTRFKTVCMEDVELGHRLGSRGFKIYLNKDIEVVHTKYYSLKKLVKNDYHKCKILTMLLLENIYNKKSNRSFAQDKTAFEKNYFISSIPLYLSLFFLLFISFHQSIVYIALALFAIFVFLNKKFLQFIFLEKGLMFTFSSLLMVIVERLVIALSFIAGTQEFIFKGLKNESN